MPVIWDEALFNQAYSRGYNRAAYWRNDGLVHYQIQLAKTELNMPNFNRNSNVLTPGCGFGYLMEVMIDLGATSVWGSDISPYIQANKATEARSDIAPLIFDINVADVDAQAQFAAVGAGGQGGNAGKFQWIVSEHVVEGFDIQTELTELTAYLDGLDNLLASGGQTGIVHLFAGLLPDDPHDHSLNMTWQTLEDWVPYAPHHYWIDIHDWRMGGGA